MKFNRIILAIFMMSFIALSSAGDTVYADTSTWQKGASIFPHYNTEFSSESNKASLRQLRSTNANYVSFIIPLKQGDRWSTTVYNTWNTPTDESLIEAINYAHSLGLKVMLKPHLETEGGEWRANINPGDRDAWFASYGDKLRHYAGIAEQTGVEDICLGTELVGMASPDSNGTNTEQWNRLIGSIREIYGGKLTYSANWTGEVERLEFWPALDYIGISAYYEMWNSDGSVESVKNNWNQWAEQYIIPVSQRFNKPVVFTEVGYRSIDHAYQQPWNWERGGGYDPQAQVNSYEALFQYWNNHSFFQGVQLWDWKPSADAGGQGNIDFTPQNKPAMQTMTTWFGSSNGGGGTTPPPNGGTPGSSVRIGIQNPNHNSIVSGTVALKASMPYIAITKYLLYWQVDGGPMNLMGDNYNGYAHKETPIDVSGWNWNGSGPYQLRFTAKNNAGLQLSQQTIYINVVQ